MIKDLSQTESHDRRNTVLIVDDVELNREVLSIMFSGTHDVRFAGSGEEAIEIIKGESDQLCAILLDYLMPGMDGLTLLEKVRTEGLVDDIPVFLITASLENDVVHRAYNLGVMDYIQRPISPFIVQRRIENVIELFRTRRAFAKLLREQSALLARMREIEDNPPEMREQ